MQKVKGILGPGSNPSHVERLTPSKVEEVNPERSRRVDKPEFDDYLYQKIPMKKGGLAL